MIRLLLCFVVVITSMLSPLAVSQAAQAQRHDGTAPVILIIGDSLSSAYRISPDKGWVALLEQKLHQQQYRYRLVNASITGDTTANGLSRLPLTLEQYRPELVIIELGGNDGLRGLPLARIKSNLGSMINRVQSKQARVLLVGMQIPPNYGKRYTQAFNQLYQDLAKKYNVALLPFLLAGVGDQAELMQADGIHPTEKAQPLILQTVWPYVLHLISKSK